MTRVDKDKYSVLIRSDYIRALSRLAHTRPERDLLIRQAVESFIDDYSFEQKDDWIRQEAPRNRILTSARSQRSYHMYLQFVNLPDSLVKRLERSCRTPSSKTSYDDLGIVLNTAIRLYLKDKESTLLRMNSETADEATFTNHA
jgi:hypothetical protein